MTARIVDVEALRVTDDLSEWARQVSERADIPPAVRAAGAGLHRRYEDRSEYFRARDAQVAELLEAADDIVEHGYGMKAKDRLCAALSAIRGGATG
jgi:hypothetical protein